MALVFSIDLPSTVHSIDPAVSYRHMYKKTKWNLFTKKTNNEFAPFIPTDRNLTNTEILDHINKLNSFIASSIEKYVPKFKPDDNVLNYINLRIKKLHKKKSFLISPLNRTRRQNPNPYVISTLNNLINIVNVKLKAEFKSSYEKYWDSQIRAIDHRNVESFFPKINRFFRPKGEMKIDFFEIDNTELHLLARAGCNINTLPKVNKNLLVESPSDILNVIGAYYEQVNSPRIINADLPFKDEVEKVVNELVKTFENNHSSGSHITEFSDNNPATGPRPIDNSIFFTSVDLSTRIFRSLPNKTSSGLDNIPPIVLKHLPPCIIREYTTIFNNCLNNRFFPDPWKRAKILPILKKGKPASKVSSYRPISLTPAVSKVYEAVISFTLRKHTYSNNIIPDNQFGFRTQHSTTHAIHKITTDTNSHLHKGDVVSACLVDLEKAFDSVWFPIHSSY
ncbi:uncharacterized protein LOC131664099 [Phymastichus coffea]|uniref:uncharacterized protein LOC131664099 n=1 Tax=Phymastichus coffea TaxID=108790 RepID=UPI00273B87F8|nr:uncharacterized protein LOC131664099 [Phymastichus coffea]